MDHQPQSTNTEEGTNGVIHISESKVGPYDNCELHDCKKDCAEHSVREKPENVVGSRQTSSIKGQKLVTVAMCLLVLSPLVVMLYVVWNFALSTNSKCRCTLNLL